MIVLAEVPLRDVVWELLKILLLVGLFIVAWIVADKFFEPRFRLLARAFILCLAILAAIYVVLGWGGDITLF